MTNLLTQQIITNTITFTNIITDIESLPFDEVQLITTIISTGTVLFTLYNVLETLRPYVHLSVHYNEYNEMLLTIKNTGLRAAYRIMITFVGDIKGDKKQATWSMNSLVPQTEIEMLFDNFLPKKNNQFEPQDYKIEIIYFNKSKNGKKFTEYFDIKNHNAMLSQNLVYNKLLIEMQEINNSLKMIANNINKNINKNKDK